MREEKRACEYCDFMVRGCCTNKLPGCNGTLGGRPPMWKPIIGIAPDKDAIAKKHSHYYKACPYDSIDIYRVIELFRVTDPCLQHVAKKALVAGGRGHKDIRKDVQDMIDTLERWKQMREEERG